MSRKTETDDTKPEETRVGNVGEGGVVESVHTRTVEDAEETEPAVPARPDGEILPHVAILADTITKCSPDEIKNYMATADFLSRKLAMRLADMWPDICRTAKVNGDENKKPAKVGLAYGITIDHSNINMHDTAASLSFSRKFKESDDIQEDLTQTEFKIPA